MMNFIQFVIDWMPWSILAMSLLFSFGEYTSEIICKIYKNKVTYILFMALIFFKFYFYFTFALYSFFDYFKLTHLLGGLNNQISSTQILSCIAMVFSFENAFNVILNVYKKGPIVFNEKYTK